MLLFSPIPFLHTVTYFGRILVVYWSKSVIILVPLRNLTKLTFNQKICDLSTKKYTKFWLQKYGLENQNYSGRKSVILASQKLFLFSPSHITYIKKEKKEGESKKLRMKNQNFKLRTKIVIFLIFVRFPTKVGFNQNVKLFFGPNS